MPRGSALIAKLSVSRRGRALRGSADAECADVALCGLRGNEGDSVSGLLSGFSSTALGRPRRCRSYGRRRCRRPSLPQTTVPRMVWRWTQNLKARPRRCLRAHLSLRRPQSGPQTVAQCARPLRRCTQSLPAREVSSEADLALPRAFGLRFAVIDIGRSTVRSGVVRGAEGFRGRVLLG
jgi:hypothetical protein